MLKFGLILDFDALQLQNEAMSLASNTDLRSIDDDGCMSS